MKTAPKGIAFVMLLALVFTSFSTITAVAAPQTLKEAVPDANLRKAIINTTKQSSHFNENSSVSAINARLDSMSNPELWASGLNANFSNKIFKLDGLEHFPAIKGVSVPSNYISSIGPLTSMPSIKSLDFSLNSVKDLSPLSALPNLTSLKLGQNYIENLDDWAPNPDLNDLEITRSYRGNASKSIKDISPLSTSTKLRMLWITDNQIEDITPLKDMTMMYHLYLSNNKISDISAVQNMTTMGQFQFSRNKVRDISPVQNMSRLFNLMIDKNEILEFNPSILADKPISYMYANDQTRTLTEAAVVSGSGTYTIETPVKLEGHPVTLTSISNGGYQSADNSTITWDNLSGTSGSNTFEFSIDVAVGTQPKVVTWSGKVTSPWAYMADPNPPIVTPPPITKYTLSFDTDGGSPVNPVTVNRNTTINLNQVTTKSGYEFYGWHTDKELTNKVTSIKMNRNATVYAKWITEGALDAGRHEAYITGYEDGSVRPDDYILRSEIAAILFRTIKDDTKTEELPASFPDINEDDWHRQYVAYLTAKNIIHGYPDGTYKSTRETSRAEFMKLIALYSGIDLNKESSASFSDLDEDYWAVDYIKAVTDQGWVEGYTDGTVKPEQSIQRAEAIKIINRMNDRWIEKEDIPEGYKNKFWDLKEDHWAFNEVIESAFNHDYIHKENGAELWEY